MGVFIYLPSVLEKQSLILLRMCVELKCIQRIIINLLKHIRNQLKIVNDCITIIFFAPNKFIIRKAMLKLNQFLNLKNEQKNYALMRVLKNSIKRSLILPSFESPKIEVHCQYESKLTGHNFRQNDLTLLFKHLYSKNQMSISDRNLIRRILLTIFPQSLISAGGKKLIQYTKFYNIEKNQKFQGNNIFYLVLRGEVKIHSPFYNKKIKDGMYFGHMELLCRMPNDSFCFTTESETSIISVSCQGFFQTLQTYFKSTFDKKRSVIPKVLSEKLQGIQILLLCDQMKVATYKIGTKTNKKGQKINNIFFIQQGEINQPLQIDSAYNKIKINRTIGLNQIILQMETYLNSNFAMQQTKGYSIQLSKFMKIVGKQNIRKIKQDSQLNNTIIQVLECAMIPRTKTQTSQKQIERSRTYTENQENANKFVRIRKVNLPYCKSKSLTSDSTKISKLFIEKKYQTDFVFIRKIETPRIGKSFRLNRENFCNSQQISPKRFYLNNIQIPSLSKYSQQTKESN